MRFWQDENRLYCDSGNTVRFMNMPDHFQLCDVHPALIWLADRALTNTLYDDISDPPIERIPGNKVAILNSGGRDSAFVKKMLDDSGIPNCSVYYRWANEDSLVRSRLFELSDEIIDKRGGFLKTESNFHEYGLEFSTAAGTYNWLIYAVGAILLADHYDLNAIIGGYLYDAHVLTMGYGFRFPGCPYLKSYKNFVKSLKIAGLEMPHIAGVCSEYIVETIMAEDDADTISCGCEFSNNQTGFACWKCCRKLPYRGINIVPNETIVQNHINKRKSDTLLYYSITLKEFNIKCPSMDIFSDIDTGWQKKYIAFDGDKFMNKKWISFIKETMLNYGVEPMYDKNIVKNSIDEFKKRSNIGKTLRDGVWI